jgi:Pentapeptide repeats (8 copies)
LRQVTCFVILRGVTTAAQAWIAVLGAFATALVGILKYFNYRGRRDRVALVGQSFSETVDALSSKDEIKRLAAAILLRRFFDRKTEQGSAGAPYQQEAIRVIAALLRTAETGQFQKLLADGLAYAPTLQRADLQECNLAGAYLGDRPERHVDLSQADLFKANLTGASLKGATARGTVFYGAVLVKTVLENADLTGADFRDADLEGAGFDGAALTGARFSGATNVPPAVLALLGADRQVVHDGSDRSPRVPV